MVRRRPGRLSPRYLLWCLPRRRVWRRGIDRGLLGLKLKLELSFLYGGSTRISICTTGKSHFLHLLRDQRSLCEGAVPTPSPKGWKPRGQTILLQTSIGIILRVQQTSSRNPVDENSLRPLRFISGLAYIPPIFALRNITSFTQAQDSHAPWILP